MTLQTEVTQASPPGVMHAETAQGLRAFCEADCAAAIWHRQMPPRVQAWLQALEPEQLPSARLVVSPEAVLGQMRDLGDEAGLPDGPERDWLEQDISHLSRTMCALVSAPLLRLRLDVVTTNACRKFHVDAITARLVCTYRGTGTQYGQAAVGTDPDEIFTVQTGAPILLRGTVWPPQPAARLLHRSPPIEGTGETRMILVVDPLDRAEPHH